jgi:glycosyltransferase involved in cell wall biosynthesis
VFIAWRSPWFFETKLKARKSYLWLHDVMAVEEFTPERLKNLDKVIVLSEYHRSLFPNIPDDKIFLSANGIDTEEFDMKMTVSSSDVDMTKDNPSQLKQIEIPRDPHKIIYQSSHTRGLSNLLDIWPSIKVEVPDATLYVMYGWNSFIAVNRDHPERMEWMERMQQRIAMLDGVTDLGKVSQEEVVKHTLSAGIWAYPTTFPEISCITAMKAQAGGAVPVVNKFAALKETVIAGVGTEHDQWTKEAAAEYEALLLDMLLDPAKQEKIRKSMMTKARNQFKWEGVAKQWIQNFKS